MKPIPRKLLLGNMDKFTPAQKPARERYVEDFPDPPSEWLWDEPANRIATGIYNTLVESAPADPRFREYDNWELAADFGDLLKSGGDAYLWTLIRIGLDECLDADVTGLMRTQALAFIRRRSWTRRTQTRRRRCIDRLGGSNALVGPFSDFQSVRFRQLSWPELLAVRTEFGRERTVCF